MTQHFYDMQTGQHREEAGDAPSFPEPPVPIAEWRDEAKLSKAEFLIRVKDAGILTKADAKAAAKGEWPTSMQDALNSMTAKQAEDAEITWASVVTVHRKSPIISFVQAVAGLTDEQVDDLFAEVTP